MKILFAYDYPESGTESVLKAVAWALKQYGHEVICTPTDAGRQRIFYHGPGASAGFDVAHFWNTRAYRSFADLPCPFGITVHGFHPGAGVSQGYIEALNEIGPDWVHTMDQAVEHYLAWGGVFSTRTKQVLTKEGFRKLPLPPTVTIGTIGDDPQLRGFETIEAIAADARVKVLIHNSSKEWIPKAEMIDRFYSKISVYVSRAFMACGPIPPQEALLCGRPVLATRTETMDQIIRPRGNGELFDGTETDGVYKLNKILTNLGRYHQMAPLSDFNNPFEVAQDFLQKWEELV